MTDDTEELCDHCAAFDEPEHGVIVGYASPVEKSICTVCYADKLHAATVLSEMESKVQAHKRLTNVPHRTIADRLGLEKTTIDTYAQRIDEKYEKASRTVSLLQN
jgi:hypothetical protein